MEGEYREHTMEGDDQRVGEGTAEQAREKVSDVTDQAQEKAGEVAEQAGERVRDLTGQAREQAKSQIDQRSTQAGERVRGAAEDLRSVSTELRNQGKDGPANIAVQAADRIERAGTYLQDSGPDTLLHDAEDFGRRRPWAVLAGGVVAGIVAARILKASSRDRYAHEYGPRSGTGSRTDADSAGVGTHEDLTTEVRTEAEPAGVR